MSRNTGYFNSCFNPKPYETELSQFGKKVLKNLLQQWSRANVGIDRVISEERRRFRKEPNYQRHQTYKPIRKGFLTFGENYCAASPSVNCSDEEQNFTFNFNGNDKTKDIVPRPQELLKVVENQSNADTNHVSRDDLLQPKFYSIIADGINTPDNSDALSLKCVKNTNITWGEMFDTELIPQTIDLLTTTSLQQTEVKHKKKSKDYQPQNFKLPLESDTVNIECNKKLVPKRKSQTKISNALPKKVKKPKNETTSKPKTKTDFRKQKYSKTVNNWLNNVDPNNAVDEEILPATSLFEDKERKRDENQDNTAFTIEINPNEKSSKKIQTKLANKGGVMKFGKPEVAKIVPANLKAQPFKNMKDEAIEKHVIGKTLTVDPKEQPSRNIKDKAVDKKSRTKFIAPIKSQVPVQDVKYAIHGTDDNQCYQNITDIEYNEVVAVLIYRNGFCQLNKHHTDDSCLPEGILLYLNDCFFYITSVNNKCLSLDTILHGKDVICYDGKSILIYLKTALNIQINDQLRDVKVGGSLIDPDHPPENFTELQKIVSLVPQYTIATDCVLQKAAWYTTLLKESYTKLKCMLVDNSLWKIFVDIEMRLLPIIADMECRGIRVDLDKIKSMESILVSKMNSVEQECYRAAGKVFQINSTVQVRAILYDELKLDTKCNVKIKETICKGAKSTSETMLRSLVSVHALPKLILEYRHLHKAHATFLAGIAQHVRDGIVKPTWVQTAAATGRIASNNPNIQAIPKAPFSLVMFPDSEQTDEQVLNFRSVYTSREGYSFLAADFKHIECRVFAHASADTALLDALNTKHDLFLVLAAKWLNKPLSEISAEDRERTKRIIYASLYGAGARKLMDILDVSYEQTLAITASFNRTFPSLKTFGRSVVSRCEKNAGRLATVCGRHRLFHNINSGDFALKSHAERQAVNFIVQGSAADLCKTAMVLTSERLGDSSPAVEAHLLLQIHDELVWEVKDQQIDRAAAIIKESMESCGHDCGMPITLPVAISTGKNWGDMKPYGE